MNSQIKAQRDNWGIDRIGHDFKKNLDRASKLSMVNLAIRSRTEWDPSRNSRITHYKCIFGRKNTPKRQEMHRMDLGWYVSDPNKPRSPSSFVLKITWIAIEEIRFKVKWWGNEGEIQTYKESTYPVAYSEGGFYVGREKVECTTRYLISVLWISIG